MAHASYSAFSPDGAFYAVCADDGKLKLYETSTGRLKQEYVPDLHLSSPCSTITWIKATTKVNSNPSSQWKKRKKKSISEDIEEKNVVAIGSVNGTISLYDVASAAVSKQLQEGHNSVITALAWTPLTDLFTASEDKQIVNWNLSDYSIKSKWKAGKGKITAIAVSFDGKSIFISDRMIRWLDLETKQVIQTFTGHTCTISSLNVVKIDDDKSCLVSSSFTDSYLSVWSLNETTREKSSPITLTIQDEPLFVSVRSYKKNEITILTTTRIGQAHLFKCQPNDSNVSSKPMKPTLTIMVLSDSKKESVQQIPILTADLTNDEKMLLAYGSFIHARFEKVAPDFSEKSQCLIRVDYKKSRERKEESVTKIKAADTESNVEYLMPSASIAGIKRNKSSSGSQLPLKDRLDNLSLDDKYVSDKVQTKGDSMVHLLIQGLQSKERNILENVLYNKKQNVITSTIAKLPVQAIMPLLKELTIMLQAKTYPSKIATMWLKTLISTHAGQLMSHPDTVDALTPILSFVDTKLKLMTEISRLRGRINLITGQISSAQENQENEEEALLVYQDPDSSDEETDVGEVEMSSESDDNWEELSNLGAESEDENCKSDDDVSMCS